MFILCFSIVFPSLKYRAVLTPAHRFWRSKFSYFLSLRRHGFPSLYDLSGYDFRNIILLPDIKALPFLPAHHRSSSCISASEKSVSHGITHGDTLLYIIPPLALPKSGTVEDLSSSQPVTQAPAGSFLNIADIHIPLRTKYSTPLHSCQTAGKFRISEPFSLITVHSVNSNFP